MKKEHHLFGSLILLLLFTAGCTQMVIEANRVRQNVYFGHGIETEKFTRVGEFTATSRGSWALFGLVPLNQPDLQEILKREISRLNGNGVINLKIITQQTFVDGLISAVTLGLYSVRTMKVSGTVVKLSPDLGVVPLESASAIASTTFGRDGIITYHVPGIIVPETVIDGLDL